MNITKQEALYLVKIFARAGIVDPDEFGLETASGIRSFKERLDDFLTLSAPPGGGEVGGRCEDGVDDCIRTVGRPLMRICRTLTPDDLEYLGETTCKVRSAIFGDADDVVEIKFTTSCDGESVVLETVNLSQSDREMSQDLDIVKVRRSRSELTVTDELGNTHTVGFRKDWDHWADVLDDDVTYRVEA